MTVTRYPRQPKVTLSATIPVSPNNGDMWFYPADASHEWVFRYDAASGYWKYTGGLALVALAGASGLNTSGGTSYIASGASIAVPFAGDYHSVGIIPIIANNTGSGVDARVTTYLNGAASGPEGIMDGPNGTDDGATIVNDAIGMTAAQTIDLRYKANVASVNMVFYNFRLEVTPVRVH